MRYLCQHGFKLLDLDSQDIRSFLNVCEPLPSDQASSTAQAIEFLDDIIHVPVSSVKIHPTLSLHDLKRHLSVRSYLCAVQDGTPKVAASEQAARQIFPDKSERQCGVNIRSWAKYYLTNYYLPVVIRGQHQKVRPMLCESDVQEQCRSFLRTLRAQDVGVKTLKTFIENDLFPGRTISIRSCHRYLEMFGYSFVQLKKGMYVDGHEREDVRAFRQGFLHRMFGYEKFMATYEGPEMATAIEPVLADGDKKHVLVVHDESLFYSNDGVSSMWVHPKHPPLRKKDRGRCIMVSEFLCECHGRMKIQVNGAEHTTTATLTPGKNEDGWWTAQHLIDQITSKMLPIFNQLHPGCVGVFLFDNSTNHGAFATDALSVSNMNLKTGGKQNKLRNGWYERDGHRVVQPMVTGPDLSHCFDIGTAKGIKFVLEERGLWTAGLKLDSAKELLASQPDFVAQKSLVEEAIEASGHVALFLPKFHCEFIFIKLYWGALKYFCREHCDYSFAKLLPTITTAMDHVTLASIRRYARKCWRYMDAYRSGLSVEQVEWAVKKQRSHRRINMSLLNKS